MTLVVVIIGTMMFIHDFFSSKPLITVIFKSQQVRPLKSARSDAFKFI